MKRIFFVGLMLASACAAASGPQGVRFNTPGVVDLARHEQMLKGAVISTVALDAAAANGILAAPALDQEHATLPFSDYLFGCPAESKTCVSEHERKLLAASSGVVQRDQKRLSVKPASAPPLVFVDWTEPTTKTADGDSELHWYIGTLPQSGLHQVEVQFGHDAPGSFLVNPQNGKTAFVHSGSDIAAVSPDGMRLVTFDTDNPPLTLRVAALDETGPRVELECTAREGDRSTAQFKGWQGTAFDLVLENRGDNKVPGRRVALRASFDGSGWRLATSDATALSSAGFACRAPPAAG